jgi:hypothetical protein
VERGTGLGFTNSNFRFPVSCILFSVLIACGATSAASRPAPAVLLVRAPIPDVSVWVDEKLLGEVGALPGGVELRPGDHRVEIRHDRYHTRYFLLRLAPGEKKTLDVTLAEDLP